MEAIALVKAQKYDLLFMDIRMPGMDGLKVTDYIRNELGIDSTQMLCFVYANCSFRERYAK